MLGALPLDFDQILIPCFAIDCVRLWIFSLCTSVKDKAAVFQGHGEVC